MKKLIGFLTAACLAILPTTTMAKDRWDAVKDDIVIASQMTDFDVVELAAVAFVESSFKAKAKSKGSTAKGLMQVTAPTAAYLIEHHGYTYGLDEKSDMFDPRVSGILGALYLTEVRDIMENRLGRRVNTTEMYMGYKFSPYRATRMLMSNQDTFLLDLYPEAADKNMSVYFHPNMKPRTVREVYKMFDQRIRYAMRNYGDEASELYMARQKLLFEPFILAELEGQVNCNYFAHVMDNLKVLIENKLLALHYEGINRLNYIQIEVASVLTNDYVYDAFKLGAPSGRTFNGFNI